MKKVYQRNGSRNHRLQMLCSISQQLNQEISVNGVVYVAVESIWQTPDIDFVAVLLGEDELGPFRYEGVRGVDDPLALLGQQCNLPLWGVLAQALVHHPQDQAPDYLIVKDIGEEARPQPDEFPWRSRTGSLLIIPLRHIGKTLGAIVIGSRTPNYLSNGALCNYFYTVAGFTTIAIQEAQTRQQSNRWVQHLISLQAFTRTIMRTRQAGNVLALLNDELVDLFGDVQIRIFLVDFPPDEGANALSVPPFTEEIRRGGPALQLCAAPPPNEEERRALWSPELMKLIRWVLAAEQPLFFNPTDPLDESTDLYYRSNGKGVLIPIGEEKATGVIYISAPNRVAPFEESDLIVMRTIANSAAIALDNIQLYQKLEQKIGVSPSPDKWDQAGVT
ncbi:MAG: GAF domain-containing protein [Caldilineaceae bacterium]|nr:GAF domain-containing protein [Caldilineaceae bacterium]